MGSGVFNAVWPLATVRGVRTVSIWVMEFNRRKRRLNSMNTTIGQNTKIEGGLGRGTKVEISNSSLQLDATEKIVRKLDYR